MSMCVCIETIRMHKVQLSDIHKQEDATAVRCTTSLLWFYVLPESNHPKQDSHQHKDDSDQRDGTDDDTKGISESKKGDTVLYDLHQLHKHSYQISSTLRFMVKISQDDYLHGM